MFESTKWATTFATARARTSDQRVLSPCALRLEPGVEQEQLRFSDRDFFEFRVNRIEQVVELAEDNCAGHAQRCTPVFPSPTRTERLNAWNGRLSLPCLRHPHGFFD